MSLLAFISILMMNDGCSDQVTNLIKQNLDSRFTKYEIVEIKNDSANIYEAANIYRELKIKIALTKLECQKAEMHYDGIDYRSNTRIEKWSMNKASTYMDSITNNVVELCLYFMELQVSKKESCSRVKFRIIDGPNKIEKEEYFYYHELGNSGQAEIIQRPVSWNEYLEEKGSVHLLDECYEPALSTLREMMEMQ